MNPSGTGPFFSSHSSKSNRRQSERRFPVAAIFFVETVMAVPPDVTNRITINPGVSDTALQLANPPLVGGLVNGADGASNTFSKNIGSNGSIP